MSSAGILSRSSSAIVVRTVRGFHLLKIDGYSRTKKLLSFGEYTRSCSFSVGDYSWHIRYYPNGSNCSDAECISFSVVLDPDDGLLQEVMAAEVRLSLLDHAGEPVPDYVRTGTVELPSGRISLSCSNFIDREELEESEYLINDRFTVRCDVTLMKPPSAAADPPAVDVAMPPSELCRDMAALLRSEEGADVTFKVGGESFAAHRCVLAARSPVFRAELYGSMKESTGKVHVEGVDAQAFKALLYFVYTDTVPVFNNGKDETSMAQHLLVAADRYNLERLKLICEHKLCKRIDVSSAATTLALAEQHHCSSLKKACMDFLYSPGNLKAVEATEGFEHLARSCPLILRELIAKLVAL
ncbi:hypothetical protein E2562_024452 [Oryza meyeriana var. granulata]|uniref:BTB domain-containing protein n=1 Tax=Oryza meyeriana var. granulata TaxID=110450 RepID=A0A6G1EYQ1_9ORYZ|nr:hypothetical protein E2562_024452 [Oryza meyeriana var. granulata]